MDNDARGEGGKISQMVLVLDEEAHAGVESLNLVSDLHYRDKGRSAMETLLSLRH